MFKRTEKSLHRLKNNQNDWDNVPESELNAWQKIAKKTKGIITAGNAVTLMGTVAVMNGLYDFVNGHKVEGTVKIVAGSAADAFDGLVADKTKTKGRVGRNLDPSLDAVKLAATLIALEHVGAVPFAAAVVVGAPKVADTGGTIAALVRGREMNPEEKGKMRAVYTWIGLSAFAIKATFDKHMPGFVDNSLEMIGWAGTVGGTAYGMPATGEYLSIGFGPERPVAAPDEAA